MADKGKKERLTGTHPEGRQCWIYKDARRGEMYLYLAKEDGFDAAPRALIEKMGELEFVMELELHPGRKLARADVSAVIEALDRKGYYLQLPPVKIPGGRRLQ